MAVRPKIKIELTPTDWVFELAGWLILTIMWGLSLYNYATLPDSIPTHFNAAGQIDDYGSKSNIFLLPVASTVMLALITLVNRFPHIFNYPVEITAENAERQYRNATRVMRYLKLMVVMNFFIIDYNVILSATGKSDGLGPWFLPLSLGLTVVPVIFLVMKSVRQK